MTEQVTLPKNLCSMGNPHQSRYFPRRTAAHGGPTPVQRKGQQKKRERNEDKVQQKETAAT